MKEDKTDESFKQLLNELLSKSPNKMNGWVKLAELPSGTAIYKHSKKGYIAHFFLN